MIILVIAGHVLEGQPFSEQLECNIIRNWIYLFHMPLFIFISGYFSRKKDIRILHKDIWKLLEPLILFQIIAKIFEYIIDGAITLNRILTPWWVLWYLLSLIYWRLLIQIIPNKLLNNTKLMIITTLCISIIGGFLPLDNLLSAQRTLSLMPFFFLGYSIRNKNLFFLNKYKPLCLIFFLLTIIIPISFSQYLGNLTYSEPYNDYTEAIYKIIIIVVSILMSISFINICPITNWSIRQGRLTMQYFILHAFILRPLLMIISKFDFPISLLTATIISIVVITIIGIASQLPYFDKITNPSSVFRE